MFYLDPKCAIWIIRKSGNIVLWSRDGMFSGPLLAVGGVYEVKGQPLHPQPASDSPSPFGAYTVSPFKVLSQKWLRVDAVSLSARNWMRLAAAFPL